MFGFVEVEELIFGERSAVVVDPAEERIKAEFDGVKRTYLPMHSILRIDEVRKPGVSKCPRWTRRTSRRSRSPSTRPVIPARGKSPSPSSHSAALPRSPNSGSRSS